MRHDQHDDPTIEDHDRGLQFDLPRLISRRRAVTVFAGSIGSLALAACGSSPDGGGAAATTPATTSSTASAGGDATTEVPEETAGPFPGDGSNGPNVLAESGVVRSDITKSIGDLSGTAGGVPTTIEMTLLDVAGGGKPLAGAAVYIWHCDREGRYSMYDIADQNYLRGVQETGSDGKVTFKSIFPAAYSGRWPHIHFEVYPSLAQATTADSKLRTSQLALPEETCNTVYATDGYSQSLQNLAQTSLETDNVFSDGYSLQLATVTGNVTDGMTATLNVPV